MIINKSVTIHITTKEQCDKYLALGYNIPTKYRHDYYLPVHPSHLNRYDDYDGNIEVFWRCDHCKELKIMKLKYLPKSGLCKSCYQKQIDHHKYLSEVSKKIIEKQENYYKTYLKNKELHKRTQSSNPISIIGRY